MNLSAEKDYTAIKGLLNYLLAPTETSDPDWEMHCIRLERLLPYVFDPILKNLMTATVSLIRETSNHNIELPSLRSQINILPDLNDDDKATIFDTAQTIASEHEFFVADHHACSEVLDRCYRTIKAHEALGKADNMLSEGSNITDVFADISEQFEPLLQKSNEIRTVASFKDEVMSEIAKKRNGEINSLSTGLPTLDEILGHFGGEQLIILAGRPGMGKTTFAAAKIGDYVAGHHGNVLFFSQEMSCLDVVKRIVSSSAKVDFRTLFYAGCPQMNNAEYQAMADTMRDLYNEKRGNRFYLTGGVYDITEICAAVRSFNRRNPLSLIIIDYLTLIGCREKNAYEKASKISDALRLLTKETKIPILCLSQMNRNYEARGQKTPQNSDLRDSGKIEQDAHVIIFIAPAGTPKGPYAKFESVKLYITKNRGGKCGELPLNFYKDECRFEEV